MKSNASMLYYSFNPYQRRFSNMLVTLTLPMTHVKDEVGCDHTFDISQNTTVTLLQHFWMVSKVRADMQRILLLQTPMSKVILRKEIKTLFLNTVLKIFIRQYRTQAGNHGNCCFVMIFENVLEYVLFRSEKFFFSYLDWIISPWSINIRCNDSNTKQWLKNWTMEDWTQARHPVFGGCKLSPPTQTNKQRRSEETKSCFFVRSSPAFVNKYFHPYLW